MKQQQYHIQSGDLFERVYDKLHALAKRHFRRQSSASTLQPTALLHEVFLRLARYEAAQFADREHYLAIAATAMRQILIDRERRRRAAKRGAGFTRIPLEDVENIDDVNSRHRTAMVNALALDGIITHLAELNPRQARVVELRVFAGMTVPEVASVLSVGVSTIEKDWRQARAWMRAQLRRANAV
ncbi:MAG: ECF-type sigma factor [Proteobacteria bacterium]|nr:ECF-type sigma factor [Pseudomonadota bacterium]